MSAEEMKACARRIADELFNQGDLVVADEIFSPSLVNHSPEMHVDGREGLKRFVVALRNAFPDLSAIVEDQIAEGDKVAQRIRWSGTHMGRFLDVPPTGRRVIAELMEIHRLGPGGKFVERWISLDRLLLLQQLGADAEPGEGPYR